MRTVLFIPIAVIATVAAGILALSLARAGEKAGNSITIVYNHEGAAGADLVKRGGFSAFVQLEDRSLVFDAGGEASVILENLQSLGFDNVELDALVISHNHWDHVFGLPGVMSGTGTLTRSMSPHPPRTASSSSSRVPK